MLRCDIAPITVAWGTAWVGPHLARAGVKLTVALAAWRSRNPVVVRQPLQRVLMFSVSSFTPNAFSGRPVCTETQQPIFL